MKDKFVPCMRCESVGRKPKRGIYDYAYGPYRGKLCKQCDEEVNEEEQFYTTVDFEIEENKRAS